jgi:hypothetical protein
MRRSSQHGNDGCPFHLSTQEPQECPQSCPNYVCAHVKTDENNRPVRAKSRIVVLGNLEDREWTRPECHAPALRQDFLQLLVSLAVQKQ